MIIYCQKKRISSKTRFFMNLVFFMIFFCKSTVKKIIKCFSSSKNIINYKNKKIFELKRIEENHSIKQKFTDYISVMYIYFLFINIYYIILNFVIFKVS